MAKFLLILQMVPALLKIIKSIEEAFPEGGNGAEKLALVHKMLTEMYGGITDIWPTIEKLVGYIVEFANNIGAFKK
jgi:hypothetical protein